MLGMATFFTSDVHIGHVNIIKYSERPFEDVADMNDRLVTAWNEQVGPSDTIFILGDLAMGKMDESLPIVGRLQGFKVLLPGNHDRVHPQFCGKQGVDHWLRRYGDEVGKVGNFLPLIARVHVGHHRNVRMCHFPYKGDHVGEPGDRYVELRPKDDGEWLVHGHVHDEWRQRGRMLNVGMDAWGGHILPLEELEAILDGDMTAHSDRLPWPLDYGKA